MAPARISAGFTLVELMIVKMMTMMMKMAVSWLFLTEKYTWKLKKKHEHVT